MREGMECRAANAQVPLAVWAGAIGLGGLMAATAFSLWSLIVTSSLAVAVWGPAVAVGLPLGCLVSHHLAQLLMAG
jgi:hypothetical protein